jgi:tRNA U38,U39,U40 pseudouridine synthase TruA
LVHWLWSVLDGLTTAGLQAILQGRNRQKAGLLAPAHGLTMVAVDYPSVGIATGSRHIEK